nr:MAG TPA: hypothetical protein [Bacteriophage sp.]
MIVSREFIMVNTIWQLRVFAFVAVLSTANKQAKLPKLQYTSIHLIFKY